MTAFADYVRLIRTNRNFRRLWIAQMVSEIGDWFYAVSIYSLILELTGRAELIGVAVVLQVLPSTLIAPTAGVVNDRISRKRVMIAADIARVFIVAGMLLVRSREMIWLVYPLLFLETIGWGFFEPGRSAVLPNICKDDEMPAANALSAATWSFTLAIGTTAGGLVAAWLGRETVFAVNALSFALSAWLIGGMRFEEPHAGTARLRLKDLFDFTPMLEGFHYVRRDSRLLATLLVKGGLGLLGANLVILPLLGERVFPLRWEGLDPQRGSMLGMSLLMGPRGIGALLGPLITTPWAGGQADRFRRGILFSFFTAGLGYVLLSRAPALGYAVAAVILTHAAGSTIWVFSSTLLQRLTEDRFRGRVFSAELGCNMLSISLAGYLAGRLIDSGVSVRTAALVTGLAMFVPGLIWLRAQRLWKPGAESAAQPS